MHVESVIRSYVERGSGGTVFFWSVVLGLAIYVVLGILVGRSAEQKGRSRALWTALALVCGVVIPAIIVALMPQYQSNSSTQTSP